MTNEWTIQSFRTVEVLWLKGEKIWTLQFEPRTTQAQMMLMWWQLIMKLESDHVQVKNRRWMWWSYVDDVWIQRCENCNQKVALRKMNFNKTLVSWWIKLREHAISTNSQTVMIADISHKLTKSEYCNVNHLVRFWLAYKTDQMHGGEYGIPRKRRQDFIDWKRSVAEWFTEDPTIQDDDIEKRRIMSENRIYIHEIPNIQKVKQMNGWYFTSYTRNESFE